MSHLERRKGKKSSEGGKNPIRNRNEGRGKSLGNEKKKEYASNLLSFIFSFVTSFIRLISYLRRKEGKKA